MNLSQFNTCLAGVVVASWSLTEEVCEPFYCNDKCFVTEFTEIQCKQLGKTRFIWHIFCRKLHENEKELTDIGTCDPNAPMGSDTDFSVIVFPIFQQCAQRCVKNSLVTWNELQLNLKEFDGGSGFSDSVADPGFPAGSQCALTY